VQALEQVLLRQARPELLVQVKVPTDTSLAPNIRYLCPQNLPDMGLGLVPVQE